MLGFLHKRTNKACPTSRTKNSSAQRWFAAATTLGFAASLGSVGASFSPPDAYASYDRVVTWSDQSALDLSSVLQSQYASSGNLLDPVISDSALMVAMADADNRVNPLFHVPAEMRGPVGFWLKIYTNYTTQQVALFDARHPEVIYEVLDFRDLARTARNQVVYEILRERRIKTAMRNYREAFLRLSRKYGKKALAKAAPKSPEEKNILTALAGLNHKHSYREFSANLKAQTGQRDNVMKGLLAAEVFFPKMEQLFTSLGVPPELTRLTLVESSFDLSAYSRTGAQGIWQFMPAPGHKLMFIDESNGIDERLSPLKSTVAAGRMLKECYTRFNNWALAVTSYNHGLKGLPKLRHVENPEDFTRIAKLFNPDAKRSPLGFAGRNYYAEFLAMVHAEAYRHLFYGDPPRAAIASVNFRRIDRRQSLIQIANKNGLSVQTLRAANPDVRDMNRMLPVGYVLAFPADADDLAMLTTRPLKRSRASSHAARAASREFIAVR